MGRSIFDKIWFRLKGLIKSKKTKYQISYSQCGEDILVDYVFKLRGINNPSYLDIGANDPFHLNNTAIFYMRGCRGINIEANPTLYLKFKEFRKGDVNLNIGVNSYNGSLDFYIMNDDRLSTFSKEEYNSLLKNAHSLNKMVKINLLTIDEILNKYNGGVFPDFLSIDVEGLDFEILKSINYEKNCPKIICAEAAEYSPIGAGRRKSELIDFLVSKGYYEYANTNLNSILVRRDFWFI